MSLRTFIDQLGSPVTIPFPPQRIISLVPSQSELLADLDLDSRVVGITKFCVHPESWQKTKTIIGGTKKFRFDVIESLSPDLIIGNKEENYPEGIEALRSKYPVWMSDIVSIEDSMEMIHQLGELTDSTRQAHDISTQIKNTFFSIDKLPPLRSLYLIWQNPWMGAASGTFIHELMMHAGLKNCISDRNRYPELSREDVVALNPDLILLSSEPFPFQQKHIEEMQAICPKAKIKFIDGEMFSWYGSRLKKFPEYVRTLKSAMS